MLNRIHSITTTLVSTFAVMAGSFAKIKTFRLILVIIQGASTLLLISCGRMPSTVDEYGQGDLEIRAQVIANSLGKESSTAQTTFDSLIVEVTGTDCGVIRNSFKIIPFQPIILDTLRGIPAGTNRTIKVFTVNKNGQIIHTDSCGQRSIKIEPGYTANINSVLIPAMGSIYCQIAGIPTSIDSIFATFTSGSKSWTSHMCRSPKVNISIDNIPHGTKGTLVVAGVDSLGDTLYRAQNTLTINALNNLSIPLTFSSSPSGLVIQSEIQLPGVSVASGLMTGGTNSQGEIGTLFITEIMYAANDSEFIEIYNPGLNDLTYDTLVLDIDGTSKALSNVKILANGFFVIGRKSLPWADTYFSSTSFLDLTSTGNWITLRSKSGDILDKVNFAGGQNGLEWPTISGKRSIVLDTAAYSSDSNNYGRNWHETSILISGSTSQYGSPNRK